MNSGYVGRSVKKTETALSKDHSDIKMVQTYSEIIEILSFS